MSTLAANKQSPERLAQRDEALKLANHVRVTNARRRRRIWEKPRIAGMRAVLKLLKNPDRYTETLRVRTILTWPHNMGQKRLDAFPTLRYIGAGRRVRDLTEREHRGICRDLSDYIADCTARAQRDRRMDG